MILKTTEDIKRIAAIMSDECTHEQDMTFWEGTDGYTHATDEPRGTSADCLAAINCGGGMSAELLVEMLAQRGVRLPTEAYP
jgi:hypothetical protein